MVPSDLVYDLSIFTTEETEGQHNCHEPLQLFPAFAPQVFVFPDTSHLIPSLLAPSPLLLPELRNYTGSCPRPLQLHEYKMPG